MNNKTALDLQVLAGYASTPDDILFFGDIFIRQTTEDIAALTKECTDGPNRNWQEVCHKIKGAAAMAGALVLCDLCNEAQELDNATMVQRHEYLQRINAAFDEVSAIFLALSAPATPS
jgi:HPt (histidine-containing phosphotransfer) domain-containing protein